MEFIVRRTSDYSQWISRCPEAERVEMKDGHSYNIVEINSLDDLMKFIDKYGKIVISKKYDFIKTKPEHNYEIEIYDYWRE